MLQIFFEAHRRSTGGVHSLLQLGTTCMRDPETNFPNKQDHLPPS